MPCDCSDIKEAVEAAGFFTTEPPDTLVCASHRAPRGLYGISFRLHKDTDGWKLILWNPRCYLIPDDSRVVEFCIAWLSRGDTQLPHDVPEDIKQEYGLVDAPFPAPLEP